MSREIEPIRNVAALNDARNSMLAWSQAEQDADKLLDRLKDHMMRLDGSLGLAFEALQSTHDAYVRMTERAEICLDWLREARELLAIGAVMAMPEWAARRSVWLAAVGEDRLRAEEPR